MERDSKKFYEEVLNEILKIKRKNGGHCTRTAM